MFPILKRCWAQTSVELIIVLLCTSAYMIIQIRQDLIFQSICKTQQYSDDACQNKLKHNETMKDEIESESAGYISICNIIESVAPAILSIIIGPFIDLHGR